MLRGILASASGMITQYEKIDVLGNNVSNSQTTGYKADDLHIRSFGDQMLYNIQTGAQVGSVSPGAQSDTVTTNLSQGELVSTGLATDIAIEGNGFFAVQAGGGVEYTRDGGMEVDSQGYLALPTGQRILATNGRAIRVGSNNFNVAADGTVSVNGTAAGKIALYAPQAAGGAVKLADGLFRIPGATAVNGTLKQGYKETSNIDVVGQMSALMAASRSFQSCQQAYKVSDSSDELAVEQVGQLK